MGRTVQTATLASDSIPLSGRGKKAISMKSPPSKKTSIAAQKAPRTPPQKAPRVAQKGPMAPRKAPRVAQKAPRPYVPPPIALPLKPTKKAVTKKKSTKGGKPSSATTKKAPKVRTKTNKVTGVKQTITPVQTKKSAKTKMAKKDKEQVAEGNQEGGKKTTARRRRRGHNKESVGVIRQKLNYNRLLAGPSERFLKKPVCAGIQKPVRIFKDGKDREALLSRVGIPRAQHELMKVLSNMISYDCKKISRQLYVIALKNYKANQRHFVAGKGRSKKHTTSSSSSSSSSSDLVVMPRILGKHVDQALANLGHNYMFAKP